MDHDLLANALNRLADFIRELAQAQGAEARQTPTAQAALDLLLHDSKRIARRLRALEAVVTPPSNPQVKPKE